MKVISAVCMFIDILRHSRARGKQELQSKIKACTLRSNKLPGPPEPGCIQEERGKRGAGDPGFGQTQEGSGNFKTT